MIKKQQSEEPLFYASEDIAKPPSSNFYLRLNEAVGDWGKLAEPLEKAFCKNTGRPTDPVVYLKIYLLAYLENITYDTDLAERISDSIAIRRFLGYTLSEKTPDHSSISRNRGLVAKYCQVEEVLSRVVELCANKGLVDGEVSAVDSSLVPANASLSSLRSVKTGKKVSEHLKEIEEHNKEAEEHQGRKKKAAVSNEEFRSTTDPDARIRTKPGQPRDMYYKITHTTDGKSGVIISAGAGHADEGEAEAAIPVLIEARKTMSVCGMRLKKIIGDTGYDSADLHAFIEFLGATPVTYFQADPTKKPEGFKKESFAYEAESDSYRCPMGQELKYHSFCFTLGRARYHSDAKKCANCIHREKCIGGKAKVRTIIRYPNEASRERNIARCHTDEGREILRRRKEIVESPFGHMKTYGGMDLISCRGREKAHVKTVMAAAAYDLKKLVKTAKRAASRIALLCRLQNVIQTGMKSLLAVVFKYIRPKHNIAADRLIFASQLA